MDFDRMLRYCALLEQNNTRTWFHAPENHQLYTDAKQDFICLLDDLRFRIADRVSAELAERLIFADVKTLMFRIPRDMRIGHGKLPYQPRWGADLSGDRHSLLPLGYYIHIQPGGRSLFGTGVYCFESEIIQKIRRYISENLDRYLDVLDCCGYPLTGSKLKNMPRGFSPDDPAGELLKNKDWLVSRPFADEQLCDFDSFLDDAMEAVDRMEPLRCFFTDAINGYRKNPFDPTDWD